MRGVTVFLLWEPYTLGSGHSDTAISSAVSRVVPADYPLLTLQVVNVNIVEPDVVQVLSTDDEELVCGNGRKVRITSLGNGR